MKFSLFNKIFYKIWVPFTAILVTTIGLFIFYYPSNQKEVLSNYKENEFKELAKTVALGIEISLNSEDYSGIKKTIDFVSEKQDFDYCVVIVEDSILTSYPSQISYKKIQEKDTIQFIYSTSNFKSNSLDGIIEIRASKKKINDAINQLNQPFLFASIIILLIGIVIFYFFALKISKPINQLIHVTEALKAGKYDQKEVPIFSNDEIGTLSESIFELKDNLSQEKMINAELTDGLEKLVFQKTEQLQVATSRLISAQTIAKIGYFDYFPQKHLFIISETASHIIGSKSLSLTEDECKTFIHHDFVDPFYEMIGKTLEEGIHGQLDLRVNRKTDKTDRWLSIITERNISNTGEISATGTIQDITERKKSDDEIKRLSLVATHSSNCVIITDQNKFIQWVNNSFVKLTGYSREEIIGKKPSVFQFEKTDRNTIEEINATLALGRPISGIQILNRGKYGNEYWLDLNIVPIFNEDVITGYIAVETDVTEKRKVEEEQQLLLNLTQSQNQRLQNFAYIVSHNLRSHSGNIKALMDMIFHDKPDLKEYQLAQMMRHSTDNLFETIDHLAEVALLITNKEKHLEKIPLREVAQKAIRSLSVSEINHQVTINNLIPDEWAVLAVPAYLDSIILNLLTNAIKYRSDKRLANITFSAIKSKNFMTLMVQDNGLGIDLERHRKKLFGMYKTFHKHPESRGIGLFITKNQIEAMGGFIDVESKVDEGSIFYVNFKHEIS